jgi:hypothetical protein
MFSFFRWLLEFGYLHLGPISCSTLPRNPIDHRGQSTEEDIGAPRTMRVVSCFLLLKILKINGQMEKTQAWRRESPVMGKSLALM